MKFLEARELSHFYQDGDEKRYILNDLSCEFERGKFYTILGESGSGKTTFLSFLTALDEPKSGSIYYEEQDIKEIGLENYRRNKIGIIFQAFNIIPYMTAVENVLVAMGITDNKLPEDKEKEALRLLDYIGITKDKATRTVNKLSGGEQQRVAIARALSTNVELIVADEPTGNLNREMEEKIVETFQRLAHKENKCVIVVTHSQEIAKMSDVTLKLVDGKFI